MATACLHQLRSQAQAFIYFFFFAHCFPGPTPGHKLFVSLWCLFLFLSVGTFSSTPSFRLFSAGCLSSGLFIIHPVSALCRRCLTRFNLNLHGYLDSRLPSWQRFTALNRGMCELSVMRSRRFSCDAARWPGQGCFLRQCFA